ncbi:hypothetical protein SAMN05192532_102450 [Alteribacillus iranensis]|uniref:DUF1440 domain-containing protein n=2 Tax=Alteribacillus iranensis TaxID=930128 RepID=A0A1I2BQF7_9BACI|nr:hypothetical protein [Alteribacillus iranensis]SFE58396.1 hypothetical protein SAMN05192532_102450 [Alteribacillus iranensis]
MKKQYGLWGQVIGAGVAAGTALGLFLKAVEQGTGVKVYTLLLNVDYIPVLQHYYFSEFTEFGFHLLVSIGLTAVFAGFLRKKRPSRERIVPFIVTASTLIGVLYFPVTVLSEQTPSVTSIQALIPWLIGHSLYGWILGMMMRRFIPDSSR